MIIHKGIYEVDIAIRLVYIKTDNVSIIRKIARYVVAQLEETPNTLVTLLPYLFQSLINATMRSFGSLAN